MGETNNRMSGVLLAISIVCLIVGLMPSGKRYTDRATHERVTEWRLGFDFSPLWEYVTRESSAGFKMDSGFRFASWSWIPVATGSMKTART